MHFNGRSCKMWLLRVAASTSVTAINAAVAAVSVLITKKYIDNVQWL